ncbi:MAG TPA: lysylphosphatidylglycerol synthase transmembrane domain-containing protein [Chitinophagaceae bacterium]
MKSKLLSFLKYFLLLIVAAALLFFAFKGMDLKKIGEQILHANMFWVAVSGLISVIAFVVRAYRWNLLIEPMGYSPSLKNTTYSLMVGYFANLAIPRLGEVSRCGALSKSESIPFNKLLGTVIVERVIDVISLLLCMLFVAVIEFKRLGSFFSENIFNPIIKKFEQLTNSPLILTGIIVVLIVLTAVFIYFKRKNKIKGTEAAISKLIKGFIDGFRSVANLKRPGRFIFHSILIWFLYYLGTYVALFAFSFTTGLGAGAALFLLVASGLGMSAPVQGGIGAYHLLVSQGLMLYGLSQQDGLTFATLLHTLQLLLVVVFGVISLILLFSENKKRAGNVQPIKNI